MGIAVLYAERPNRQDGRWRTTFDEHFVMTDSDLPEGINPQWSDDEPIEVELKIEKI